MNQLRNWIFSVSKRTPQGAKGQIATFLLLVIVAVLILAMATANLGRLSLTATTVANAADSAGLTLGSQLASHGNFLNETLKTAISEKAYEAGPPPKACKKSSIVGVLLAAALAIVATVVLPGIGTMIGKALLPVFLHGSNLAIMATAGAVVGAMGGAIGGAITGTGAFVGAMQGAAIGAGIAGGASWLGGLQASSSPMLATHSLSYGSMTGALAGGGMAGITGVVGSPALQGTITSERVAADAMMATANSLSGLADADRIRESSFFQALSQTIDDPTMVQDTIDSDRDGDIDEKVPAFQFLWDQRVKAIKQKLDQRADTVSGAIDGFLTGPAQTFGGQVADFLGELSRKEVEGADGRVVELARALEDAGTAPSGKPTYDPRFWKPGPTKTELDAWKACETCKTPPDGYDELDQVIEELQDYLIGGPPEMTFSLIETLRGAEAGARLALRDSWVKWLYDPESGGDSYDTLRVIAEGHAKENILGLTGWIKDLKDIRDTLPMCRLEWVPGVGTQFPKDSVCKIYRVNPNENKALMVEVDTAETAARSLEQLAKDAIGTPTPPDGYGFVTGSLKIAISAELKDKKLSYSYEYTYQGQKQECTSQTTAVNNICLSSCTPSTTTSGTNPKETVTVTCGVCPDNKNPNKHLRTTTVVTETCQWIKKEFSAPPMDGWLDVAAPDLTVPWMSQTELLGALSGFRSTLNSSSLGEKFATIDHDVQDEFAPVLTAIEVFKGDIDAFLAALPGLAGSTSMGEVGGLPTFSTPTSSLSGLNPVTYQWTDSRGTHSVKAEVGPFKMAWIKNPKGGFCFSCQRCLELTDYQDDGGKAWVRISRQDPTDQQAGPFWSWNPFGGSMTKTCRASYSYDRVGIAGVK